ncbi:peroxiredoxin [Terrihabitans soli]|uniref:thioredoxin-dependent peroxiredoxin n=1 Tax=Terrihabitans soli TaxID=708113 RepID=A0A6S6QVP3_9HYPH|nr:peroxiredoxin [Terrihabitans soli]BCJ91090.1 peroxiredoxin [Terrihabitans soli]
MTKLQTGLPAPDFDLPTDGGGRLRLKDLKGRKTVLYFYPKDDTPTCTQEAIAFNGLRKSFQAADTELIGFSADSPKKHDRFKAKHGLDFPLVSDEDRAVLEAYGLWVEKQLYGRKYMGIERTTLLIDREGKIARIWPKVSVKGHAEEVLEAAKAL